MLFSSLLYMGKNVLLAVLIIGIIAETVYIVSKRPMPVAHSSSEAVLKSSPRPKPSVIMKGMKFTDSPLFSKAYLIAPAAGALSGNAQKALTGWNLQSVPQSDGSTLVTLIPSEAEDIQQTFTVKQGFKLYFIEMNLVDDKQGVDNNRGDDIGVLVDTNGIVQ